MARKRGITVTEAEARDYLTDIMREVFDRDDIVVTKEMVAADLVGWDSFHQVEILLAIEHGLGIRFRPGDVKSLGSVGELMNLIRSHAPPSTN